MASGPITSWQIDGETVETLADFILGGLQNHCRLGNRWVNSGSLVFICAPQACTEKAMAPHSSTLAWKIPWREEEPGRLQSMGSLSQTRLSDFTFPFQFHALEKAMTTHSSVLAWRIPGTEEPGGLPSMGLHRVGHD